MVQSERLIVGFHFTSQQLSCERGKHQPRQKGELYLGWGWRIYLKRGEIDTMDLIGKSSFTIPYFYYNHIDVAGSVKQIMATY